MKVYNYNELSSAQTKELCQRIQIDFEKDFDVVKPILNDIKKNGLKAVIKYSKQFDKLKGNDIRVPLQDIENSETQIDEDLKQAINVAKENIDKFHKRQIPLNYKVETISGVLCSRESRSISDIGLYIPGGNAILPSTLLMLGIPAKIAGCKRIAICTPVKDKVHPSILYIAKLLGINEIYTVGGAQAIGLMAYGDETVPKVNKIFGPGNQYVTAAKMIVANDPAGCAIDMPAGPSEVLVIADENSNPEFIASDLLSQAEHGSNSQSILISTSMEIINEVQKEIDVQTEMLGRKEFIKSSLKSSYCIKVNTLKEAFEFSNNYAPEHLILHIKNADDYKGEVENAGSVFLGEYSPESAGDYASGTNHSLPTYGYAKAFSGINVESFLKHITFQKLSKEGLINISNSVIKLAETEELYAHKNAITIRLKK